MNTQHRHRNSLITSPPYRPPGRAGSPGRPFSSVCLCLRELLSWATLQEHAFSCSFSKGRGRQSLLLLVQLLRLSQEALRTHPRVSPFPRQKRQQALFYWKAEQIPSWFHQDPELSGPSNSVSQLRTNWRLLPALLCDSDWLRLRPSPASTPHLPTLA